MILRRLFLAAPIALVACSNGQKPQVTLQQALDATDKAIGTAPSGTVAGTGLQGVLAGVVSIDPTLIPPATAVDLTKSLAAARVALDGIRADPNAQISGLAAVYAVVNNVLAVVQSYVMASKDPKLKDVKTAILVVGLLLPIVESYVTSLPAVAPASATK